MLDQMEPLKESADYLVGWVDGTAGGRGLGRGQIHQAHYLPPGAEPQRARSLDTAYQALPDLLFGVVPKSIVHHFMPLGANNLGFWGVNTAKYLAARLEHHHHFRQSLVAFNFLLDYVPNWERAFRRGLIQYQSFIPREAAPAAFRDILALTLRSGLPSTSAVVLKRHRPDGFLFTHAVDGFSMAMDFAVPRRAAALQQMTHELDRIVLDAGGRFYFAKDSSLTPHAAAHYLGETTLARFQALKARCDPHEILQSELYRRVLCPAASESNPPEPAAVLVLREPALSLPSNGGTLRAGRPAAESGNGKGH
jgi:FAD/FMN-containing dehydrogenase